MSAVVVVEVERRRSSIASPAAGSANSTGGELERQHREDVGDRAARRSTARPGRSAPAGRGQRGSSAAISAGDHPAHRVADRGAGRSPSPSASTRSQPWSAKSSMSSIAPSVGSLAEAGPHRRRGRGSRSATSVEHRLDAGTGRRRRGSTRAAVRRRRVHLGLDPPPRRDRATSSACHQIASSTARGAGRDLAWRRASAMRLVGARRSSSGWHHHRSSPS